jgi:hypothetical protein
MKNKEHTMGEGQVKAAYLTVVSGKLESTTGMMPMTDDAYNKSYDAFMQGLGDGDVEALFNSGIKMLISLTTIIELQQRIIGGLESKVTILAHLSIADTDESEE